MLSSSSNQCKHVWGKSPESNPRSSLWERSLIYGYLKGGNLGIATLNEYHVRKFKGQNTNVFLCSVIRTKRLFFKQALQLRISFLPDNSFCIPAVMEDFFYAYLQQGSDPNKSNSPSNDETDTMWTVIKEIKWNLAIKLSIQFKPCWI